MDIYKLQSLSCSCVVPETLFARTQVSLVASRRILVYIHPKIHSDMEANYLHYDVIIEDYVYLYVCVVFLLGSAE